jgi:acetyl-CoA acetyltransferase
MTRVFIKGVGLTKVEEHWDKGIDYLMAAAALDAIKNSAIERIDAIYVGNVSAEVMQYQTQLGAVASEQLGLIGVPSIRVEAADASGAAALREAYIAIASGLIKTALVIGVEKLSDGMLEEIMSITSMFDRHDYAGYQGITQTSLAALLYRHYLERYEVPQEYVAQFPVIMHENASTAPHAQYQFKISIESVMNSPIVSEPLRRLECTAAADGAAALILCGEDILGKADRSNAVEVAAVSMSTDFVSPFDREDPLKLNAVSLAFNDSLTRAKINRRDVNIIELHDSFSILAALILESIGYSQEGRAGIDAKSGRYSLNGELPINTFGGLKARGHPFGATGIYQVAELYLQLAGLAGKNQVDNARVGVALSLGGLGATAVSTVLRRG